MDISSTGEVEFGGISSPEGCCYLRHLSGKLRTLHACTIYRFLLRSKEGLIIHDRTHQSRHAADGTPTLPARGALLLVARRLADVEAEAIRVEVDLVLRLLQDLGNVAGVFKLAQVDVCARLLDGVADELGGAGFSLGADYRGLLLLAGLVDDEGGALGFLLRHLLGLDGGGELGREGEVLGVVGLVWVEEREGREGRGRAKTYSQRDIIEHDVEAGSAPDEVVADQSADVLTLCDELGGVELGDDALEDLVDNRGQDALVVVGAEGAVDLGQGVDAGPREDTAGDVDHLQVLCARERGDVAGLCADIVGDGRLEPGDVEVGAFVVDLLLDAAEARVLDGAVASVDWGGREYEDGYGYGYG